MSFYSWFVAISIQTRSTHGVGLLQSGFRPEPPLLCLPYVLLAECVSPPNSYGEAVTLVWLYLEIRHLGVIKVK